MSDTGATAHDRRVGRWFVTGVVALVAAMFGYLFYASKAGVELAASGYVVEPAGQVRSEDDGPVVAYPTDRSARLRLRVPVRNTSRLTLRVRHPVEIGPAPGVDDWPLTPPVRLAPGELAWLEYTYGHRCPRQELSEGGYTIFHSVRVNLLAPGGSEREAHVELPVPVRVPMASASHCAPGTAP